MPNHLLALLTAAGFLAACGDSPDDPLTDGPPPDAVESVEVAGPLELTPGASVQFTARALDADGALVPGRLFSWESDAPDVATVGDDGTVIALAPGEVTIYATTSGTTGGVFVTVIEDALPAVAWVEVEPAGELDLEAGATVQLQATAYGSDGAVLSGRAMRWETSDPAVATVSSTGLLTAVAGGAAGIRVVCESQRADLLVRVADTASYTLTAVGGNNLPALLGSFTSTLPDGATVTRTIRIRDGYLVIDHVGHTYEAVLQATISTQIQPAPIPLLFTYESQGSVAADPVTGELTFTPSSGGGAFTGSWVEGGVQVSWRPDERLATPSTFLFASD